MTTTVLTDEQIAQALNLSGVTDYSDVPLSYDLEVARAIEQAVLQSEQVQAWKKDAERYRSWRTATVNKNTAWLDAAIDYQAKHFANPEKPTADEFDAGIDAAMEKQA